MRLQDGIETNVNSQHYVVAGSVPMCSLVSAELPPSPKVSDMIDTNNLLPL